MPGSASGPARAGGNGAETPRDELAELRALLLGPERRQLVQIEQRITDPNQRVADLSEVLSRAVQRSAASDRNLRRSLQPLVEEAIEVSVRRNPKVLIEAIFPVIGSAIRKSVAAALESMMQTLNLVAEKGLSWRSLQWRFEALRTGRSFGEIALLRSLLYRVEEVFLIHAETGLLLAHESAGSSNLKNADLISAMLTAIRDFVHDSFQSDEGAELSSFRAGDHTVWVRTGPRALLAAVIRGTPPNQLQRAFQECLERVHSRMGPQLKAFDGDASPFDACRDELRGCLLGQAAPGVSHRRSSRLWLWLIPIAVLLAVSAFLYLDLSDRRRLDRLASRLNAEPGIVVYSARRADGRYAIGGIRDPLAREPGAVLAETGVSPSEVDFEWRDFYSADERFVRLRELSDRATQLERIRVYFETGESDIEPSQAGLVEQTGSIVRDLLASAAAVDASDLKVVIVGGADGRGDNEANAQLAIERAREAMRMLVARGVPAGQLAVERLGESSPRGLPSEELEWAIDRCVTFRVEGLPAVD